MVQASFADMPSSNSLKKSTVTYVTYAIFAPISSFNELQKLMAQTGTRRHLVNGSFLNWHQDELQIPWMKPLAMQNAKIVGKRF